MSDRKTVRVRVVIDAEVKQGMGAPEVLDAVSFHLDLSELNSIEADISAVDITSMREERLWVCDGCMRVVIRAQIADFVDGEHVVCLWCRDRQQTKDDVFAVLTRIWDVDGRQRDAYGQASRDAVNAVCKAVFGYNWPGYNKKGTS